jgi:pilus assembly protein CpaB
MRMLRIILSRINKMWLLMGVAVILGLAATWVTTQYLKTREARIEAEAKKRATGGTTVAVVVPQRNLPKGTLVDGSVMAARDVLADTVYEETVLATDFSKIQGTRLVRAVEQGRPLRQSDLDIRAKDFAATLPDGRRALTIDIDEINSISQMVRVGNHIDLMLIVSDNAEGESGQKVISLMQRVKVVATGQTARSVQNEPGQAPTVQRYSNVTFEVTPEEAARIALAKELGKIRAVLRNEEDTAIAPLGKVNSQTVLRGYGSPGEVIEYIIGGRGGGGGPAAAVQTVSAGVPALGGATAGGPAVPAGAMAGPGSGQITVPGVGSFPYPSVPGVTAPAPTTK